MERCRNLYTKEIIERNIESGVYNILNAYNDAELKKLNSYLRHSRDFEFTYAGLQQIVDKYLVQDRSSGAIFETSQFMYMLINVTLFQNYGEKRLDYVKRYYDAISQFKINILHYYGRS